MLFFLSWKILAKSNLNHSKVFKNHKNRTKGLIKLISQLNHVEKSIHSNINSEITILVSIRNEFYSKKIKKVLPSSFLCMYGSFYWSIFSYKFIQNQLNTFIFSRKKITNSIQEHRSTDYKAYFLIWYMYLKCTYYFMQI